MAENYFVRDIKYLFYIIFCNFNFCGPQNTAEITSYTVYMCRIYVIIIKYVYHIYITIPLNKLCILKFVFNLILKGAIMVVII